MEGSNPDKVIGIATGRIVGKSLVDGDRCGLDPERAEEEFEKGTFEPLDEEEKSKMPSYATTQQTTTSKSDESFRGPLKEKVREDMLDELEWTELNSLKASVCDELDNLDFEDSHPEAEEIKSKLLDRWDDWYGEVELPGSDEE